MFTSPASPIFAKSRAATACSPSNGRLRSSGARAAPFIRREACRGDRMINRAARMTIRDVARVAGVSVGTVSRVLNAHATVHPDTRRAVEKAITDLDYAPNAVAQSMRIRSTHTIGCVIREINISQLAGFVRAAHDALDEEGFSLLISN